MDEIKENGKWYEDVPYKECKEFINTRLQSMTRDFIAIGYYLKYVRDHELYLEDGYKDVFEFADKEYSMKRPTVNHCIKVNTEFSLDGNSPVPDEKYKDFSRSQLQELLYVSEEDRDIVTPTMTVKEIRKIHTKKLDVESKPEKKSFEECYAYKCNGCCDNCHYEDKDDCPYDRTGYKVADWRIEHDKRTREEHDRVRAEEKLSAYGTEKMVRPENSITDAEGCKGGHYCFSCSMDCQIRQEDRYCMEATLAKPFGCTTINMLECLRQNVGDKCQFINHDLAYHRSGDNEPNPCCKECKELCGYACSRAVRKNTVAVAPAQEESESIEALDFSVRVYNVLKRAGIDTVDQLRNTPDSELVKIRHLSKKCLDEIHSKLDEKEKSPAEEKPEVLHFTADDKSIDSAYGAMIAELIGNYLDNAYKSPDSECEASVFGQTYKVLKRPEVTVFYTEEGRTFFDVENARLEQEYQWRQKNKPKPDMPEEVEGFAPAQQEEMEPERVSGEVMGFEVDELYQEWPELLLDIPAFPEAMVKEFLDHEERYLAEFLKVDKPEEMPTKVLQKKQMTVAGLRLLFALVSGGHEHG